MLLLQKYIGLIACICCVIEGALFYDLDTISTKDTNFKAGMIYFILSLVYLMMIN